MGEIDKKKERRRKLLAELLSAVIVYLERHSRNGASFNKTGCTLHGTICAKSQSGKMA